MDLKLDTKKAFISGSTQGIGFAIARQLLKESAEVMINGRYKDKTEQAVVLLKEEFPNATISGIEADFGNANDVEKLLDELNNVDILINNIGIFEIKDFENITDYDWMKMFEINVMSAVRLSRKVLPKMLQNKWGRIIFISSESGVNIAGNMIHYGMSKAAMMAVSNGLSKLTKGTEVTVNTILGGPTYSDGVAKTVTEIAKANNLSESQMKAAIVQQTNPDSLLQRFIEPDEIASIVTYLSSPLSIASNGACLRADGGTLKTI